MGVQGEPSTLHTHQDPGGMYLACVGGEMGMGEKNIKVVKQHIIKYEMIKYEI